MRLESFVGYYLPLVGVEEFEDEILSLIVHGEYDEAEVREISNHLSNRWLEDDTEHITSMMCSVRCEDYELLERYLQEVIVFNLRKMDISCEDWKCETEDLMY